MSQVSGASAAGGLGSKIIGAGFSTGKWEFIIDYLCSSDLC